MIAFQRPIYTYTAVAEVRGFQMNRRAPFTEMLCEAVLALAGEGELVERLEIAGKCLVLIQDHNVPVAYQVEFEDIRAALFSARPQRAPRQVSIEHAGLLSRRIIHLFTDAMGGL